MMGIAQKISRTFTDAVRSRGQSYFAKGRVIVSAAVAGEVIAKVRGTAKYRVRLRIRGTKLHVSCTCPYFTPTGDPCKHIWATVLVADARNLLQAPPVRPLKLVSDLPRRSAANRAMPPGVDPAGDPRGPGPGALPPSRTGGRGRKDRQGRHVPGTGVGHVHA